MSNQTYGYNINERVTNIKCLTVKIHTTNNSQNRDG
jgi:hypothetical protein